MGPILILLLVLGSALSQSPPPAATYLIHEFKTHLGKQQFSFASDGTLKALGPLQSTSGISSLTDLKLSGSIEGKDATFVTQHVTGDLSSKSFTSKSVDSDKYVGATMSLAESLTSEKIVAVTSVSSARFVASEDVVAKSAKFEAMVQTSEVKATTATVTSSLTAGSITTTGDLAAKDITATGPISAASLAIVGDVSTTNIKASGAISSASLSTTSSITAKEVKSEVRCSESQSDEQIKCVLGY